MSVVVAIKEKDNVYIGADSQVIKGGTRTMLKNPNNYKVWTVNNANHCLMAHVGNLRDGNVVRTMDGLVSDYNVYKNHIGFDFVVRKVLPDIIKELKDFGYIKDGPVFEEMDSSFLFAYEDQLFLIGSDGSVLEIDDYCAIGSGSDQAIGSLLSTEGEDPIARIIKAIKASAASDIYVDYPIIITDTKKCKFSVIDENSIKTIEKKNKGEEK